MIIKRKGKAVKCTIFIALLLVLYLVFNELHDSKNSKYRNKLALCTSAMATTQNKTPEHNNYTLYVHSLTQFHLIIEGTIFQMQGQQMRGISVVWLNLIKNLASSKRALYSCPSSPGPKHKLIYIDRDPNSSGSKLLAKYRHKCDDGSTQASVIVVPYQKSLEYTLDHEVPVAIARYDNSTLSLIQSTQTAAPVPTRGQHKVQVLYTSTYYTFPDEHHISNMCMLLYVHDAIPEMVGFMQPGTEWWPRVLATSFVDSFVAVSKSTLRDYVRLYARHVLRSNISATDALRMSDEELEANTYMSVIQNKISSTEFPGPASAMQVYNFRKKYDLYTDPLWSLSSASESTKDFSAKKEQSAKPRDVTVEPDYFISLGCLRFPHILLQAFDGLPDEYIRKLSLVFTSHSYVVPDNKVLTKHKVVYNPPSDFTLTMDLNLSLSSPPVIRIYNLGFIDRELVHVAMTGALAVTYVSQYEGFGLPIAEAFASGTLVVTTNASSMPEVGGDVAYYVNDVNDVEELRRVLLKIIRLTPQDRRRWITAGLKRATQFGGTYGQTQVEKEKDGWEDAAAEFVAHLRSDKFKRHYCRIY